VDIGCTWVKDLGELREDGGIDSFLASDDNDLVLEKSFSQSLLDIPGGSCTSAPMAEDCRIASGRRLKVRLIDSGILKLENGFRNELLDLDVLFSCVI